MLKKRDLKKFRELLLSKRHGLLQKARQTLASAEMTVDLADLPDEMDLAATEYLQGVTFRLRGREKTFMEKISQALTRIEAGTFGICEECEEDISVKRLEARPETTLCIKCKETQEQREKSYSHPGDPTWDRMVAIGTKRGKTV